jgi:hypothetical protein
MRFVYARGALSDIDGILNRLWSINPHAAMSVEARLSAAVERIAR